MAEEERKANQGVEALQADFVQWLNRVHELAAKTFPLGDRTITKARGDWDKTNADALANETFNWEGIYGAVPEGHHLRVGLSPMTFYKLFEDSQDLALLFKKVKGKTGNSYFVEVTRRVETGEVGSNRKVINMKSLGAGNHPESYGIELERVSDERGREIIFAKFFPENILSIEVLEDETSQ